jgi:hypothetical protein
MVEPFVSSISKPLLILNESSNGVLPEQQGNTKTIHRQLARFDNHTVVCIDEPIAGKTKLGVENGPVGSNGNRRQHLSWSSCTRPLARATKQAAKPHWKGGQPPPIKGSLLSSAELVIRCAIYPVVAPQPSEDRPRFSPPVFAPQVAEVHVVAGLLVSPAGALATLRGRKIAQ